MHYLLLKIFRTRQFVLFFIFMFLAFCFNNIYASNLTVNINNLEGYNRYEIWGDYSLGKWKSQLEFPLNVQVLSLLYEHNTQVGSKELSISLSYTGGLGYDYAGKFKDYDWFYFIKDEPAILGEAATDINIRKYNIELSGKIFNCKKYYWIIGYEQEKFNYIIYDGKQIGLFGGFYYYDNIVFDFDGENIKYELDYSIPYIGIGMKGRLTEEFSISIRGIYSLLVKAKEYDNHLLNEEISRSKTEGELLGLNIDITYFLNNYSSISSVISYRTIETDGFQQQEDYYGNILHEDIKARITGKQCLFGIAYQYNF